MKNNCKLLVVSFKLLVLLIVSSSSIYSQKSVNIPPKLIVSIVVDQMRYDMLTRYKSGFCEGGFKRLMDKGFFAENMHFNYVPTYTGPGHASIYTGTTPSIHGIAANEWSEFGGRDLYCVQDDSVKSVGGNEKNGKMSPKNLKVTTFGDQMRLHTNMVSRSFGIGIKDRGAILPAGKLGKAYWYDNKTGNWITSNYYQDNLPKWATEYNALKRPESLMKDNWNLYKSKETYLTKEDDCDWEETHFGREKTVFPYIISKQDAAKEIRYTPYGNTLTNEYAMACILGENLGKGMITDFMAISFSSTDYIGHAYGPYSVESEDCYYRLDADIKILLEFLDKQYGKDNYWVMMTADHGVQDVPGFSIKNRISGGNINDHDIKAKIEHFLKTEKNKTGLIFKAKNEQLNLDKVSLKKENLTATDIARWLNDMNETELKGIHGFYAFESIQNAPLPADIKEKLIKGYVPHRSGEIAVLLEPNWMSHGNKGTSHGSPFSHDTHVPFLFYGKGVKAVSSSTQYDITDIAPTISYLFSTLQPNGCSGKPIKELEYLK